jgi:hypothetical protein
MRRAGRLQTLLAALDAIVLPALGRASGAELAKPGKAPPPSCTTTDRSLCAIDA